MILWRFFCRLRAVRARRRTGETAVHTPALLALADGTVFTFETDPRPETATSSYLPNAIVPSTFANSERYTELDATDQAKQWPTERTFLVAIPYVPTLMEETERIISAQKARGAEFDTGGIVDVESGFG